MLTVAIVITTKDRLEELKKCLDSCILLNNVNEIIVMDDGSSDETFHYVQINYPNVHLFRNDVSLGLINARSKCAELAKSDIIVSIDDDCIFQGKTIIEEILLFFNHLKVAVVTIPVIDVLRPEYVFKSYQYNNDDLVITSQFRGCAHAIRRSTFLSLGGYRKDLVRQEEETDLSLRLYNEGYYVRIGNCANPILHYHSTVRNLSKIVYYQARNKTMLTYIHTPTILLPMFFVRDLVLMTVSAYKSRNLTHGLKGTTSCLKLILTGQISRKPIRLSKFLFFKKLRRNGPTLIQELQ